MEITATSKYVRVSPRKMQLLAKSVKRMSVGAAVDALIFTHKNGARALRQLLLSALANAKSKNVKSDLLIKEIHVLPGSAMKRFRAVSRGMAHTYKKRMSHIRVILTEKPIKEKNVKIKVQKEEKKSV